MQFERFLAVYGQPVNVLSREKPASDVFESMQILGDMFGEILHTYLADNFELDSEPMATLDAYDNWGKSAITTLHEAVGRIEDDDDRRKMTQGNFHALNLDMSHLWLPIMQDGWESEDERIHVIETAQNLLAHRGMHYYKQREYFVNKKSTNTRNSFFTDGFKSYRRWFNGLEGEIDTAITLLEMIKPYPDLTVVPAPPLFERGRTKTENADFLVIDMTKGEIIGVQAKSMTDVGVDDDEILLREVDQYNSERVVVIDGRADLGNVALKRTRRDSSTAAPISWPGLISAYFIQNMPIKGRGAARVEEMYGDKKTVIVRKMLARQALIGAPKSLMATATEQVGSRVLGALYKPHHSDPKKGKETFEKVS